MIVIMITVQTALLCAQFTNFFSTTTTVWLTCAICRNPCQYDLHH